MYGLLFCIYDRLRSASGLKSEYTPQICIHWCHYLKSRSDLRVFSNWRAFQILRSKADLLLSNRHPFQKEILYVLLPCHMMDVGQICTSSALHIIIYQMNAKRQSSRHKFSVPDPHFVYGFENWMPIWEFEKRHRIENWTPIWEFEKKT